MKTRIYDSYKDFLNRADKSENGVSREFAEENKDFEEDNHTNTGCWDCRGCKYCDECNHSRACVYCNNCGHCTRCRECDSCFGLSDCDGFEDFDAFKDFEDFDDYHTAGFKDGKSSHLVNIWLSGLSDGAPAEIRLDWNDDWHIAIYLKGLDKSSVADALKLAEMEIRRSIKKEA